MKNKYTEKEVQKLYIDFIRFLKNEKLWEEFVTIIRYYKDFKINSALSKKQIFYLKNNFYKVFKTCIEFNSIGDILWCQSYMIEWWSIDALSPFAKIKWNNACKKYVNKVFKEGLIDKETANSIKDSLKKEIEKSKKYTVPLDY